MSFIGLDLGVSSIKLIKAMPMGGNYALESVGSVSNPVGSVDFADPTVKQKVGDVLKKFVGDLGIKERRVVVGIPESKVYSRVVSMPIMTDAELASAISWEAEQFVPVPVAEVEMDFAVVKRPPQGSTETSMLVYLIASPKKYLQETVDFLVSVGLEPIAVESELVAAARGITYGVNEGTTVIVHFGAQSTLIGILAGDALIFSYAIPTGGLALTRALSQSLSLPLPQAEEYKRTYGLDPAQFEGKVRQALMVVFGGIVTEIHKAVEYYAAEYKTTVNRIVLSGGGAYLPELSGYLSSEFAGIEVLLADPFAKAKMGRRVQLPVNRAMYTVAVGLALRVF